MISYQIEYKCPGGPRKVIIPPKKLPLIYDKELALGLFRHLQRTYSWSDWTFYEVEDEHSGSDFHNYRAYRDPVLKLQPVAEKVRPDPPNN